MNPVKRLLRKLIQYALSDKNSIWLGWDDVDLGGKNLYNRANDPTAGAGTLSDLTIDIDKNWGGYNITNLGAGAHDLNAKLGEIATKVSKAGDTMTGALTITSTFPQIIIDSEPVPSGAYLDFKVPSGNMIMFRFYEAGIKVGEFGYSPGLLGLYINLSDFIPYPDNARTLGSASYRWANLYAVVTTIGDLILEGKDAKWKVTEEKDGIYAEDLKNGKKYKLKMEEVRE